MLMKKDGNTNFLYWKLVRSQEVHLDDNETGDDDAEKHDESYHVDDVEIHAMPGDQNMSLPEPMNNKFISEPDRKRLMDDQFTDAKGHEKVQGKVAHDKLRKDVLQKQESFSKYSQAAGEDENDSL